MKTKKQNATTNPKQNRNNQTKENPNLKGSPQLHLPGRKAVNNHRHWLQATKSQNPHLIDQSKPETPQKCPP
jgi:hypothetical protein